MRQTGGVIVIVQEKMEVPEVGYDQDQVHIIELFNLEMATRTNIVMTMRRLYKKSTKTLQGFGVSCKN